MKGLQHVDYVIYQMDRPLDKSKRVNRFFDCPEDVNFIDLESEGYKDVYRGTDFVKDDNYIALADKFYYVFNVNHPEDYHASSLSVGDIVGIAGKFFYVQGFGWKEVHCS
jgi:hypothetical protein